MIYGDYNQPLQIHIDKMISVPDEKWVYGAFNLIIDGYFYPGKEINWTLNMIINWLKSFLDEDINEYDMRNCEEHSAEYLFREAVISRIGYYYDEPEKKISLEEITQIYPKKVGIEIVLPEITDTGFELFFFRGKEKDILVFYFQGAVSKIELDIGYIHKLIASIPDI
ncbi:Imm42 family immunity protein [Pasteurella sp. PK-2025]|uniref:Imm42 family immunity protein n=1 Tax=Pasteurella sp. PK-2025 TaxID=3413133 RepID=UPI003C77E867